MECQELKKSHDSLELGLLVAEKEIETLRDEQVSSLLLLATCVCVCVCVCVRACMRACVCPDGMLHTVRCHKACSSGALVDWRVLLDLHRRSGRVFEVE